MTTVVLTSPIAGDGKSVVAAGLALALRRTGPSVRLAREAAGDSAAADAAAFAGLQGVRTSGQPEPVDAIPTDTDLTLIEAGTPATAARLGQAGARVLLVTRHGEADDSTVRRAIQETSAAGLIVNGAPPAQLEQVRAAAEPIGPPVVGVLPQDRLLSAPSFVDMAAAVDGELRAPAHLNDETAEWLVVGPISAHTGMAYFDRHPDQVVITRADRVDVALAALNQAPRGLILTGGEPRLPYVYQRAESEEFALIVTGLTTAEAANRIGELYAHGRFAGGAKLARAAELVAAHCDVAAAAGALGVGGV